ncbi:MAG: hypothetical protein Q6354_03895 [Candidatus Brocadiales bacterium]|nr:hypothetical protein [Candidatus Brocadiales bacterium]
MKLDFAPEELDRLAGALAQKVAERLRSVIRGKAKNQGGLLLRVQLIKVVHGIKAIIAVRRQWSGIGVRF